MSESTTTHDGDVTLRQTESGNSRNFETMERVFARALANVDGEVHSVGGFGRVIELDHDENMVHIEFARSTHDDPERRWMTAHGVQSVTDEEYPSYVVTGAEEQYR